jgi:hypothetical protein
MTVTIMGIAAAGMSGAVFAVTANSAMNRDASVGTTELRRFVDKVRAAPYQQCATPDQYSAALDTAGTGDPLPAGVTVAISEVEFWQPDEGNAGAIGDDQFVARTQVHDAAATLTCTDRWVANPAYPADPNPQILLPKSDNDLQRITVVVDAGTFHQGLTVTKRVFQ